MIILNITGSLSPNSIQKKIVKPSKTITINNTEYYKGLELVCREHYKNKYARLFVNYTYVLDNINSKTMALIEPVENIKIVLPVELLKKFKLPYANTNHSVQGLTLEKDYTILEDYTRKLFQRGSDIAQSRGLILVDTKYEFGKTKEGKIVLIDEIHTPDSSRYFYLEGYQERQDNGEVQKQLSKEFVRQWLITNNFQGLKGQVVPIMTDGYIETVSNRYIELYENILGESFIKADVSNIDKRIEANVLNYFSK